MTIPRQRQIAPLSRLEIRIKPLLSSTHRPPCLVQLFHPTLSFHRSPSLRQLLTRRPSSRAPMRRRLPWIICSWKNPRPMRRFWPNCRLPSTTWEPVRLLSLRHWSQRELLQLQRMCQPWLLPQTRCLPLSTTSQPLDESRRQPLHQLSTRQPFHQSTRQPLHESRRQPLRGLGRQPLRQSRRQLLL